MGGVWKTDQLATVRVDTAANGTKSDIGSREPTIIVKVFQDVVARDPTGRALSIKKDGEWVTHTWQQYYDICQRFAKALIHIGVQPHEAVNILGPNCPEWLFANVGSIHGRSARVVVMSDKEQLDKYLSVLDQLPVLKALVVWNEADVPQEAKFRAPVYAFSEFLRLGDNVEPSLLDARIAAQQPNHCCELIYTSGTTGPQKAAMIPHDNLTWVVSAALNAHPEVLSAKRSVSFLPLSHSAAQLLDIYVPMMIGSEVYFADPDALRGSLLGTLQEVRPNFFCGVPRVWEKMMESLKDKIGGAPEGLKKSLIMWAMEKGTDHTMQTQFDPVTAIPTDKLDKVSLAVAEEIGSNATTVSEAQTCEKFGKYIEEGVARANAKAASRAQHLQKFCIIPHDFSIDGNELTPTMKLKRSVVEHKYSREIEQMYA
ncbi:hypothetical protein BBJ29_005520 [Phytophthora kernoviae]|uniref:AMP-dependent synthetase/ligase domain-containing protein n=1 Tax=Phytophthora kernoviae TaxID=325452 RepID=A0A3F2RHB5_9STRA|nr:hypothetical protein BBP00_00007812 [Phytophthora kernoviae]RLN68049.1 hypothetical protein BBJ29_005520 [Phytophthora kernoviae]